MLCIVASLGAATLPIRIAILVELITIAGATFALGGSATQTILCAACGFLAVALARNVIENKRRESVHRARAEVAREIHDVLAHALAALRIQLQVARHLAPSDGDLRATLDTAERLARDGAEEVQRAVSSLRGDSMGPETFPALIDRFRSVSGIACEYTVLGKPGSLSAEKNLVLYRTLQEGLTNAVKHGRPPVSITLQYEPGHVRLRIDNVCSGEAGAPGGFGLVGLRERAELIGAILEAELKTPCFTLCLNVPV